jgi:hypothetical protein
MHDVVNDQAIASAAMVTVTTVVASSASFA